MERARALRTCHAELYARDVIVKCHNAAAFPNASAIELQRNEIAASLARLVRQSWAISLKLVRRVFRGFLRPAEGSASYYVVVARRIPKNSIYVFISEISPSDTRLYERCIEQRKREGRGWGWGWGRRLSTRILFGTWRKGLLIPPVAAERLFPRARARARTYSRTKRTKIRVHSKIHFP